MKGHRNYGLRAALLGALLALLAWVPRPTEAGIVIEDVTLREIPDPSFRYIFKLFLEPGTSIVGADPKTGGGDFITLYDVADIIPGTNNQPDNWRFRTFDEGLDPAGVSPPFDDDPAIPNITWDFIAPFETLTVPPDEDRLFLGEFSIQTFDIPAPQLVYEFGSQTTDDDDNKVAEFGVFIVPEPSSLLMAGLGLAVIGAGGVWRNRRRRPVAASQETASLH